IRCPLMFYGAGAGGVQTSSAVLGDLVSAARRHVVGGAGVGESTHANYPVLPISMIRTRYQITLSVTDEPGVLADVANIFREREVSVETLEQKTHGSETTNPTATLVIGTHEATEADLAATVAALEASPVVVGVASVLRVEGL
ncbi:MAG: ACT domain-containing protein, partial [Microbacteriaceae bacterium]